MLFNGLILTGMYMGHYHGVPYVYQFGYTLSWIGMILACLTWLTSHTDGIKEILDRERQKKKRPYTMAMAILLDVPFVWLFVVAGHPVFAAFYVAIYSMYYYATRPIRSQAPSGEKG
jgi:hypothetical protein